MQTDAAKEFPIVLFSGGFDRVHYGLVMAAAAAASDRDAAVLVSGRALPLLLDEHRGRVPGWQALDPADDGTAPVDRDAAFAARGVARIEELLQVCAPLKIRLSACEMAVRALGLPASPPWRPELDVRVSGLATFLNESGRGRSPVFV